MNPAYIFAGLLGALVVLGCWTSDDEDQPGAPDDRVAGAESGFPSPGRRFVGAVAKLCLIVGGLALVIMLELGSGALVGELFP